MLFIVFLSIMISSTDSIYQSNMKFTSMGFEYSPYNNIQLITTTNFQTQLLCSAACNQMSSCRALDYDLTSKRCRLFEGDSTTGAIVSSLSSTSFVGIVQISAGLYSSIHNQLCEVCQNDRYEVCAGNINQCQCPVNTYWTGSICALQLFENSPCDLPNSCRSDFNITCTTDCYGNSPICLPPVFDSKYKIIELIKSKI